MASPASYRSPASGGAKVAIGDPSVVFDETPVFSKVPSLGNKINESHGSPKTEDVIRRNDNNISSLSGAIEAGNNGASR